VYPPTPSVQPILRFPTTRSLKPTLKQREADLNETVEVLRERVTELEHEEHYRLFLPTVESASRCLGEGASE